MVKSPSKLCAWVSQRDALSNFATWTGGTQSSEHIKQLHWYVACRLVIEGGFLPDDITPRPPFRVSGQRTGGVDGLVLEHDRQSAGTGERAVLGGLKTKNVDVVVCKEGVGPCIAISVKGTLRAFRNLTNRMEEAVGDCTNLHIAYPALVYGFLHVLRANREGGFGPPDTAVLASGEPSESVARFHDVMARLSGRQDIRNETTRYEAIALALISGDKDSTGSIYSPYPHEQSPLLFKDFFERIYRQYDMRFVYAAPALSSVTKRVEWAQDSPALLDGRANDYIPRTA